MNIQKLIRNLKTLLSSSEKQIQYYRYLKSFLIKNTGGVYLPGGGRISTSSFNEHWSAYNLMPNQAELNLIRKRVQENSTVFDIGANVGVWTVLLSKACPNASIHSFEPAPNTFDLLTQNIERNKCDNVIINNVAASSHEGVAEFEVPRGVSIYGRIRPENPGLDDSSRFVQSDLHSVRCMRMSDYCADHGIDSIDFMKIDVEGFELDVLKGMESLLANKKIGAIYIETIEENHIRMGSSYSEFLSCFGKFGYKIYTLSDDGTALSEVEPDKVVEHNHLCLPS